MGGPSLVERLRDWPAGGQDMLSATVVGDLMTEAADTIEELLEALGQIAGKNDLSEAPDDQIEAYARCYLHECELIAEAAIAKSQAPISGEGRQ